MPTITQALATPFGHVLLSRKQDELSMRLSGEAVPNFEKVADQPLESAIHGLQLYFTNAQHWQALASEFKTPNGTLFQQRVWHAISQIPSGQTLSYQALANQVNSHPRAVANACGANHLPIFIPCHRVVAKSGLGGFMRNQTGGSHIKLWLLRHEGVHID